LITFCLEKVISDVNQRFRKRPKPRGFIGMEQNNLIVTFNYLIAIPFKDGAIPDHAERIKFRCPQGAHTGCTDDSNIVFKGFKNFALPN